MMHHHPHVHIIVPGGGLSPDGSRWIACRLVPASVIEGMARLHRTGKLKFFSNLSGLADPDSFATHLAPLRKSDWVV